MDPGSHHNDDNPSDLDHDFKPVGLALRILQLNVEGLSAAKRGVISSIAERQKVDIVYVMLPVTKLEGGLRALGAGPTAVEWLKKM